MGFLELVIAEYKLVYGELIRRKSAFIAMIMYPYLFAGFVLFFGYTLGSPQEFQARLGINPVVYMITASYILMSMLAAVDDILWRPLSAQWTGTLPYIIASPVNRLEYYMAIPLPRLTALIIMGFTSITPIYILYYGSTGILYGLVIMGLSALGGLLMSLPAMVIASLVHLVGESWRVLNIVRPIMMILLGAYYPRFYMPLVGYIVSSLLPASHIVEFIQKLLSTMYSPSYILLVLATVIALLYTPLSARSIYLWERKKVREGVQVT